MRRCLVFLLSVFLAFFLNNRVLARESYWKSNLELLFMSLSGNTENQSLGIKGKSVKNRDDFKIVFNSAVYYSRMEGETEVNNWTVNIKEEFLYWEEFYLYDFLKLDSDKNAGINYGYNGQGGCGYYLLKEERDELKGEVGLDYISEKRIEAEDKNFSSGRIAVEFLHKFTKLTAFNTAFDYFYDTGDDENWRYNGEIFFISKLREKVYLKTGLNYKFRNLPVSGKNKTDLQASTSFVIDL